MTEDAVETKPRGRSWRDVDLRAVAPFAALALLLQLAAFDAGAQLVVADVRPRRVGVLARQLGLAPRMQRLGHRRVVPVAVDDHVALLVERNWPALCPTSG